MIVLNTKTKKKEVYNDAIGANVAAIRETLQLLLDGRKYHKNAFDAIFLSLDFIEKQHLSELGFEKQINE